MSSDNGTQKNKSYPALPVWMNVALAGDFGADVAKATAALFNRNASAYDRAVDAVYNSTHVGGSQLHHIVDGQHSVLGAWQAAHGALPDDTVLAETFGAADHLARDAMSVSGINPFFQVDPVNYQMVSGWMDKGLGIPRSWTADMLTFNASEILGAAVGAAGFLLCWPSHDIKAFLEYTSALGVSAVASANPLLCIVTVAALSRAVRRRYLRPVPAGDMVMAAVRGGTPAAFAIAVSAFVGGPLWIGVFMGIAAGILVRRLITEADMAKEGTRMLNHLIRRFPRPWAAGT